MQIRSPGQSLSELHVMRQFASLTLKQPEIVQSAASPARGANAGLPRGIPIKGRISRRRFARIAPFSWGGRRIGSARQKVPDHPTRVAAAWDAAASGVAPVAGGREMM